MKNKKILITASIIAGLLLATTAIAATVLFPSGGGTGTSTKPSAGQVLIGNSSSTYSPGFITAGTGITISTSSGAITINATGGAGGGLSSSTPFSVGYIPFATSSNSLTDSYIFQSGSNIGIGTTTPAMTLVVNGSSTFMGNVYASNIKNIADGVSYYDLTNQTIRAGDGTGAINHSSRLLLDSSESTSIDWSVGSTITLPQYVTDGLLTIASGVVGVGTDNSINWDTAYTDRLKWDGGATGLTASTGRTSLGLTDTGTFASTTWAKVANNLSDLQSTSTARTNLGVDVTKATNIKDDQWLGYYGTSTTIWDDPFSVMYTTSTIDKVIIGVKDGSVTGNIYYSTSQTAATSSSFKLFSTDQTWNSTTTGHCYTAGATSSACSGSINASSTPGIHNWLRFYAYNASTSALTSKIFYHEN